MGIGSSDIATEALVRVGVCSAEKARRSAERWADIIWPLSVTVAAAALCLPFLHMVYWLGDEGVLLDGASRMLNGDRLYKDFFEFLPPGGFILTVGWLKVFGASLLSARVLAIASISSIALLSYLACLAASGNRALAAGIPIAWIIMSQGQWTVLSHHWLASAFAMVTVWATLAGLEEEQTSLGWPFVAGLAAGMAGMIVETCGAYVALAAIPSLLKRRRKRADVIAYIAGCGVVPLAIFICLIADHTFSAAFRDVIQFAAQRYSAIQYVPYGNATNVQNWPLEYVFPLAALLTSIVAVWWWRSIRSDWLFWQCVLFCAAGFLACFPRPDIAHIEFEVPLAFPLVLLCTVRITAHARSSTCTAILAIVAVLVSPTGASYVWLATKASRAKIVETPSGSVTFPFSPLDIVKAVRQVSSMPAAEGYFYYPYMPLMPFLTHRKQVSRYDLFIPEYTRPAQYQSACRSVLRSASWAIIYRPETDPKEWKRTFPAMDNPRPPEVANFERVLHLVFEPTAQDGGFEILHRRSGVSIQGLCATIPQ